MDVGANPTAIAKPPLCKGRCPAGAEGLWHCEGRSIFGQGHNPSVSFADSSLYTREPHSTPIILAPEGSMWEEKKIR